MSRLRLPVRRGFMITLAAISSLIIIGLVTLSPLTLATLGRLSTNWNLLANIGQTYGAISAFISSLALGGVIVSLLYQARDGRTAREQSIRILQHQLIRLEMDDPSFMTALGAPWNLPIPAESVRIREHLYIHMWVTFWAGNYVIGEMTQASIRSTAKNELFNSNAGRAYWAAVGKTLISTSGGRYSRFIRILDEEYKKVIADAVPVADPVVVTDKIGSSRSSRKRKYMQSTLAGTVLIVGILTGRRLDRLVRRVPRDGFKLS